ncbi:unnamed protein product [Nesidiocoris tenuis]|uniref:Uncharacterized protein n=1 Tax=Nesidiocoris tenuis TaxID=355587 RepID=A0A6H5HF39_9HEMI|nr:unnamed protein product [Nesidiocoris tenuis]
MIRTDVFPSVDVILLINPRLPAHLKAIPQYRMGTLQENINPKVMIRLPRRTNRHSRVHHRRRGDFSRVCVPCICVSCLKKDQRWSGGKLRWCKFPSNTISRMSGAGSASTSPEPPVGARLLPFSSPQEQLSYYKQLLAALPLSTLQDDPFFIYKTEFQLLITESKDEVLSDFEDRPFKPTRLLFDSGASSSFLNVGLSFISWNDAFLQERTNEIRRRSSIGEVREAGVEPRPLHLNGERSVKVICQISFGLNGCLNVFYLDARSSLTDERYLHFIGPRKGGLVWGSGECGGSGGGSVASNSRCGGPGGPQQGGQGGLVHWMSVMAEHMNTVAAHDSVPPHYMAWNGAVEVNIGSYR